MLIRNLFLLLLTPLCAAGLEAQNSCPGTTLAGIVVDSTGAIIPGASLSLDQRARVTSGADGRFHVACVANGKHNLHATSPSFASKEIALTTPVRGNELRIVLQPASVDTTLDVEANDGAAPTGVNESGASQTISGKRLTQLADDPDDLLRELQQMAAAAGGPPGSTTVSIDGFLDAGALPPKSSIAFVKVNPDLFSAEYREPPFEGGRVEVYTRPGAAAYHGALFATNSSPWMNARDPFSTSRAAIGKQRYGFELNGPVRKQGSNFSMTLEHRSIDNFAVVNAVTPSGPVVANVATPQRLWVGTSRVDWQLGPKNIAFISYSANVNHLQNLNVGGTVLQEAGYDSGTSEHTIRLSDVTTFSPKLMHEARVSFDWRNKTNVPNSNAPSVQVSGAFTGGGTTIGNYRVREFTTEWDDDAILVLKSHTMKAGLQMLIYDDHRQLTNGFNGTYIYGNLGQYAANQVTQYSVVTGDPEVDFTQARVALFFQDDWKLKPNFTVSYGLRYYFQNDPLALNGATPRVGFVWTPDKAKKWSIHGHIGTFAGQYSTQDWAELQREDGVHRITSLVYGNPGSGPAIYAKRTVAPDLRNIGYGLAEIGVDRDLGLGFKVDAQLVGIRMWDVARTLNINTPLTGDPYGPRPIAPNINILQAQNSGRGLGDGEFVSLSNFAMKRVQFFYGAVRINLRDDADDDLFFQPQSAYTDSGEFSLRTGRSLYQTFGNVNVVLPYKVQLSGNFYGNGNTPYNITTGFDNNGDGSFNDRPQFAPPGSVAGQNGAVQTPYGLLVPSGGVGVLRRNLGTLPWSDHLDGNIQRAWVMTRDKKADHQQTLMINIRSSNLLNHTNITAAGGVLGSPLFGVPYAADNGRRIEGGLRYSF